MINILFCISFVIFNHSYSMHNCESNNYETREQFEKSLDDVYQVGTTENCLVMNNNNILKIEGINLVCYDNEGKKETIIAPDYYRITLFTVSPDQTKVLALQSYKDEKGHDGLWLANLVTKSTESKDIGYFFLGNPVYTLAAISNYNTIAVGNPYSLRIYQCACPEKNLSEHPMSTISMLSPYDKKFISLKFNKQGTRLGYKTISERKPTEFSKELVPTDLPDENDTKEKENKVRRVTKVEPSPSQSTNNLAKAVVIKQKKKNSCFGCFVKN